MSRSSSSSSPSPIDFGNTILLKLKRVALTSSACTLKSDFCCYNAFIKDVSLINDKSDAQHALYVIA